MAARVAVLLDGGFVTKKLKSLLGRFPAAPDVVDLTTRIMRHQRLSACELFRVCYYDAPPLSGAKMNPLSRATYNFGTHPVHAQNKTLQEALAITADVAVRRGDAVFHGWKLRPKQDRTGGPGAATLVAVRLPADDHGDRGRNDNREDERDRGRRAIHLNLPVKAFRMQARSAGDTGERKGKPVSWTVSRRTRRCSRCSPVNSRRAPHRRGRRPGPWIATPSSPRAQRHEAALEPPVERCADPPERLDRVLRIAGVSSGVPTRSAQHLHWIS